MFTISSVAASPVDDILKSTGSVNPTSSSGGVKDLLLGLILGKLLSQVLNLPAETVPGGGKWSGGAKKEVIGFYAEDWSSDPASLNSLKQHYDMMQTVTPFWGTINEDGTITPRDSNNMDEVKRFAREKKVKVTVLLNNAKSGANSSPIHGLLNDSQSRTNAVANIEEYVKSNGFDGVNIDFESVPPEDRDKLTLFMEELSQRLRPQGLTVAISVFPKQDETTNDVAIAYDYEKLPKYVDQIVLMTYDNHGEWSGPGPVADISWVENNLKYALRFMPKSKLYLGIAAYGYDWTAGNVNTVNYSNAMETATKYGAKLSWDEAAKVPYFKYSDANNEHQVWFENSRSLSYKLDLVSKYDLKGLAIWRLGQEDPAYWQTIKEKVR
jgi:spore germination protein YaaH